MLTSSRHTIRQLSVALWVLGWVSLVPATHATLTPYFSLDDLARAADAIVIATATHTESVWVHRQLVTRVTLEVETTLQGNPPDPLQVVVPGGVDANRSIPVATVVPGQPRISRGERSLLFLRRVESSSDYFGLLGGAQGRFVLLPGATGTDVALRDLSAVDLVREDGVSRGPTTAVPAGLLIEHLRALLAANGR